MGVALYVVLEKAVPGLDASFVCGKSLAKAQRRIPPRRDSDVAEPWLPTACQGTKGARWHRRSGP
jgi:hypothetical protein